MWGRCSVVPAAVLLFIAGSDGWKLPPSAGRDEPAAGGAALELSAGSEVARGARAGPDGQPMLHQMFGSPLLVANLSGQVDSAALLELAFEGYRLITGDEELRGKLQETTWQRIQQIRPGTPRKPSPMNNLYFDWQMGNQQSCWASANVHCAGRRWDSWFNSRALKDFKNVLAGYVRRYVARVSGMPVSDVPDFDLRLWAAVHMDGDQHGKHDHSSRGSVLVSGVFYSQVPPGSGAIRFFDARTALTPELQELNILPGAPYDHMPKPDEALLFPPFQYHGVMPSHPGAAAAPPAVAPPADGDELEVMDFFVGAKLRGKKLESALDVCEARQIASLGELRAAHDAGRLAELGFSAISQERIRAAFLEGRHAPSNSAAVMNGAPPSEFANTRVAWAFNAALRDPDGNAGGLLVGVDPGITATVLP